MPLLPQLSYTPVYIFPWTYPTLVLVTLYCNLSVFLHPYWILSYSRTKTMSWHLVRAQKKQVLWTKYGRLNHTHRICIICLI